MTCSMVKQGGFGLSLGWGWACGHDDGAGGMIIGLAGIGGASGHGSGFGKRPRLKNELQARLL